jgi:4-hydroxybenzoate polyprenyltransferase
LVGSSIHKPKAQRGCEPAKSICERRIIASLSRALCSWALLGATTLYNFWLKHVVLVDVFLLSGLYAIRVVIDGVASGIAFSEWLMAFSCSFFLSLAPAKRVAEVDAREARSAQY